MFGKYLLITILMMTAFSTSMWGQNGPTVGELSPSLMGRTLDDRLYRLLEDTDKPKVISFFWTQCAHCKLELPELAKLEKKYPKVKFIAVHSKSETPQEVRKFLNSLLASPKMIMLTTGSVQEEFLYKGLPHTVVLDSENIVLANFSGYTPKNMKEMDALISKLNK